MHYSSANSYLDVNKTKSFKFKVLHNIRSYEFCLGRLLDFTKNEKSEVFLNGTLHDFLLDCRSIEIEGILSIHEYLTLKRVMK